MEINCTLLSNTRIITKHGNYEQPDRVITITDTVIITENLDQSPPFIVIAPPGEKQVTFSASKDQLRMWISAFKSSTLKEAVINKDSFDLLSVLGQGHYGKVMLGRAKQNGQLYAIKSVKKSKLLRHNEVSTVYNERNILSQCQHPFVVNIHFAFQTRASVYMVLDYAPGGELYYHLRHQERFSETRARLYVAEIALALRYLHKRGIIYRDLKPENVLLDAGGHAKLADFGLSRFLGDGPATTFCGTPDYICPELVKELPYDQRLDIWTIGVFIYELIAGEAPFKHKSTRMLYQRIVNEEPTFPKHFSPEAVDLITRLLKKNPDERMTWDEFFAHPWFSGLDFDAVMAREITPEFVPEIHDLENPPYISSRIKRKVPMNSEALTSIESNHFEGFSLVIPEQSQDANEIEATTSILAPSQL